MLAFFFKLLLRITSYLPLPLAHRLGAGLGWLLFITPNSSKKVARINIALCFPDMSPRQQTSLLKETLIESGKTMAEMGIMWLGNSEYVLNQITSIEGEEHLTRAIEKHKGVLLAMPHIGSWELVNLYAARHYPVTSLYKPPHMKSLDNIIRESRQRTGATLVPTDTTGVRAVSKALKNGELVVILPDQQPYLHMKNGIFANFFGVPANSMTLMSKLADKTGADIVYAYTKRAPAGKGFTLVFKPASVNDDKKNLQHSVELMNHDIEQVVLDCPAQYQWTYKRFKARPDNQPRRY